MAEINQNHMFVHRAVVQLWYSSEVLSTIAVNTYSIFLLILEFFSIFVCSCWWWAWRKWCAPRELRARSVNIGRPCDEKFPPNEIRNQVSDFCHSIVRFYVPYHQWIALVYGRSTSHSCWCVKIKKSTYLLLLCLSESWYCFVCTFFFYYHRIIQWHHHNIVELEYRRL